MGGETNQNLELDVVESVNDVNEAEWNNVVRQADRGSLFHRYEWLKAIEAGLGYQPKHLLIRKDGNLIGVYPNFEIELEKTPFKKLVSLRPTFGGPIATTDEPDCISIFSEAIPDLTDGRTILHKIRAKEATYLGYNNLLKMHGYTPTQDGCRFQLSLSDGYASVKEGMRRDRRRQLRQGMEHEYELVEEELTHPNVRRFHERYTRAMDRLGGSAFPLSFLTQLRQLESNVLFQTLRIEGEYVGGMISLLNEQESSVHAWLIAVPEEYFEYNASELLYDGSIRWGVENGYETLDMGYTSSDATDGLYNYKKSYGGEVVPNFIWEKGCSIIWPLVRSGRGLYWSRVKSPQT